MQERLPALQLLREGSSVKLESLEAIESNPLIVHYIFVNLAIISVRSTHVTPRCTPKRTEGVRNVYVRYYPELRIREDWCGKTGWTIPIAHATNPNFSTIAEKYGLHSRGK